MFFRKKTTKKDKDVKKAKKNKKTLFGRKKATKKAAPIAPQRNAELDAITSQSKAALVPSQPKLPLELTTDEILTALKDTLLCPVVTTEPKRDLTKLPDLDLSPPSKATIQKILEMYVEDIGEKMGRNNRVTV